MNIGATLLLVGLFKELCVAGHLYRVLSAAIVLSMGLLGPASAKPPVRSFYDATAQEASTPPGTLLKVERIALPAFFRGEAWRVLYATRDYANRPLVSSGFVVLPSIRQKQPGPRKIVAWAHPTVGTNRNCAPSLASNPLSSILGINDLTSLGYAVVATDYPGLGTPGPVGYLVGRGQAYAVLDAVRAVRQMAGSNVGSDVVLWGFSQGAHAALFGSIVASRYAPELNLKGVAAIAPPTDLHRLLIQDYNSVEGRVLASFTLQSWAVKYGLSLTVVVSPNSLNAISAINRLCIDGLASELALLSAQKHLNQDFLLMDPRNSPGWKRALAENSINSFPNQTPYLIVQGEADEIVDPRVTLATVRTSCRNGAVIRYVSIPAKGHSNSAKFGAKTAIAWISERFAGRPAVNSCR